MSSGFSTRGCHRFFGLLLAAIALSCVARSSAAAASYYVEQANPACSDLGSGTESQPYCSITAAINAHKGATTKGFRPRAYGRSGPWNQDTVNLEIVLEEAA